MIKGCQRKIIQIQGSEKSPFESAYFILRRDAEECCRGGDDILHEANRIIESGIPEAKRRNRRRECFLRIVTLGGLFSAGAASGAAVFWLISLMVGGT